MFVAKICYGLLAAAAAAEQICYIDNTGVSLIETKKSVMSSNEAKDNMEMIDALAGRNIKIFHACDHPKHRFRAKLTQRFCDNNKIIIEDGDEAIFQCLGHDVWDFIQNGPIEEKEMGADDDLVEMELDEDDKPTGETKNWLDMSDDEKSDALLAMAWREDGELIDDDEKLNMIKSLLRTKAVNDVGTYRGYDASDFLDEDQLDEYHGLNK
eukprot:gene691-694_t